ncbi:MAG: hypothetical protein WC277_09395, partial [Bacilli bacterium]
GRPPDRRDPLPGAADPRQILDASTGHLADPDPPTAASPVCPGRRAVPDLLGPHQDPPASGAARGGRHAVRDRPRTPAVRTKTRGLQRPARRPRAGGQPGASPTGDRRAAPEYV